MPRKKATSECKLKGHQLHRHLGQEHNKQGRQYCKGPRFSRLVCQATKDNVTGSEKWDKKGQQMELLCNIYKEPKAGARKLLKSVLQEMMATLNQCIIMM